MKKTILIAAISAVFLSIAMSSCSGFSEGFREGWNSTAPEEYRY